MAASRVFSQHPFTPTSPWNTPLGNDAEFASAAAIKNLTTPQFNGSSNNFSVGIGVATAADPVAEVRFTPGAGRTGSAFNFLDGGGLNSGNTAADEAFLLRWSIGNYPYGDHPVHYHSTTNADDSSLYAPPTDPRLKHPLTGWNPYFYLPAGIVPSPDDDGHLAVFQPDGRCLEFSSAIITTARDAVYCTFANYTDPFGVGDGWANGMRASGLPNYAGLLRAGELASGAINHALICYISPTVLSEEFRYPAVSFDRSSGYTGSIPMGSLLAIPPDVDLRKIGLTTPQGYIVGMCLQTYGVYIVDRGGSGGMTFRSEVANPDVTDAAWDHTAQAADLTTLRRHLAIVSNNSETALGGGGARRVPPKAIGSKLFNHQSDHFPVALDAI